jgi:hypothetical protein
MRTIDKLEPDVKNPIRFIARPTLGYYMECFITNHTGKPVYYLDSEGLATAIIPTPHTSYLYINQAGIAIQFKENHQLYQNGPDNKDIGGTYSSVFVTLEDLDKEPIYIKQLNIVLLLDKFVGNTLHPYQYKNIQERLKVDYNKIKTELGHEVTFSIIANDPLKRITELIQFIDGRYISIPVLNIPDQPAFCNVYFKPTRNSKEFEVEKYDLEEILKNNGLIKYNERISFIGTSKEQVTDAYNKYVRDQITEMHKDVENKYKDLHAQEITKLNTQIDNLKQQHITESLQSKDKLQRSEELNHRLESENKRLTSEISLMQAQQNVTLRQLEYEMKQKEHEMKRESYMYNKYSNQHEFYMKQEEAKAKQEKSKYEAAKEKTGFWAAFCKAVAVVVPIVCGIFAFRRKKILGFF